MLTRLTLQFEVLTPLFLGDSDQAAELRVPSVKGALRHWYRAVEPEFRDREFRLFGGTGPGQGQAAVHLRLRQQGAWRPWEWPDREIRQRFQEGSGTKARNGVAYLGYSLKLRGNESRTAVPAGTRFTLECLLPRADRLGDRPWQDRDRLGLVAALWVLGHLGSLGTRARRGFGSLQLVDWNAEGDGKAPFKAAMEGLPRLGDAPSAEAWLGLLGAALRHLDETLHWSAARGRYPRLGTTFRTCLLKPDPTPGLPADLAWAPPLQAVGLLLQKFRSGHEPDRSLVRDHLLAINRRGGRELGRQRPLRSPQRTAFGLPLTFRFVQRERLRFNTVEFTPDLLDASGRPAQRHPSLLWIRTARIGGEHHGVVTRLDGEVPGDSRLRYNDRTGYGGRQDPLPRPEGGLLDAFLDACAAEGPSFSWRDGAGR